LVRSSGKGPVASRVQGNLAEGGAILSTSLVGSFDSGPWVAFGYSIPT
jgi:hypothetical protein